MTKFKKYKALNPSRASSTDSIISPQSNGWNHIYAAKHLLEESGIEVGDKVSVYSSDDAVKVVKDKDADVRVATYPYKGGAQIKYPDAGLPLNVSRGTGIAIKDAKAKKGEIVFFLPKK